MQQRITGTRWLFAVLAVLLAAAAAGLYLLRGGQPVEAVRVVQADLTQYVQADGKVVLQEERKLFAEAAGRLLRVYVKVGDVVQDGQVLADIDPIDAQYRLRQLELQLEQVQAEWAKLNEGAKPEDLNILEETVRQEEIRLRMAEREWSKTSNDFDAGLATKEELRLKEEQLRLSESALNVARNRLALAGQGPGPADAALYESKRSEIRLQQEQLRTDLQRMRVIAEKGGTVTELPVREGQVVAKGSELLTLADPSRIEIESEVKESFVSQIFLQQEAIVAGPALGKEQGKARVVRMAPVADAPAGSANRKPVLAVTLAFDDGSVRPIPGYDVDVSFVVAKASQVLQIPVGAVKRASDGTSCVWTIQQSRAVRIPVETGIGNEAFVQVTQGLQADSLVIVHVPESLRDGQKVKVVSSF